MKTISIYPLSILLILFFTLAGCSSDSTDNTQESVINPLLPNNGNETTVLYRLLNKNGNESTVFDYGEEILFELIVTNTTKDTLRYDDEKDLVKDGFIVYNSEGKQFNPIVSQTLIYRKRPVVLAPGEKFSRGLIWPWHLVSLPPGKYSSACTINIEELRNKTYTVEFEIK